MIRRLLIVAGALLLFSAAPAYAQYPPIVVTPGSVVAGNDVTVTGTGCPPNVPVTISIQLQSGGPIIQVGTGTTGPDGTFQVVFTVPADTEPGVYIVIASCGAISQHALLTVREPTGTGSGAGAPAPTSLSRTGFNLVPYVQAGVVLMTVGALLVLVTRKRRTSPTT
jgi:hypothetical protein